MSRRRQRLAVALALAVAILLPLPWRSGARAQDAPTAERRVALVIGNSAYATPLPNPRNDAEAVARSLKELGFDVISGYDLGRDGTDKALKQFSRALEGADVGLFYYAGHGFQVDGRNYLVPVDTPLRDLSLESLGDMLALDQVQDRISNVQRVNILIIDACRDNPFAARLNALSPTKRAVAGASGLAAVRAGNGTLIAFAAGPGEKAFDGGGGHSPFTAALLDWMPSPGLEVTQVMRRVGKAVKDATRGLQQPWQTSSLVDDFYFRPVPTMPVPEPDAEEAVWAKVHDNGAAPELITSYLRRFPQGAHAGEARRLLVLSSVSANPAAPPSEGGGGGTKAPPDPDAADRAAKAVIARAQRVTRLVTGGFTYADTRMPTACGRALARRVGFFLGGTVVLASLSQAGGDAAALRDEGQFGLPGGEGTWLLEGSYAPAAGAEDGRVDLSFELVGRGPGGGRVSISGGTVPVVPDLASPCRDEARPKPSVLTRDETRGPLRLDLSSPLGPNPVYVIREPPERIELQLRTSAPAHLYCLDRDSGGATVVLLPNAHQPDARVEGGKTVLLPADLPTSEPGTVEWLATQESVEVVKCFASERPLALPAPIGDPENASKLLPGIDEALLLRTIRAAAGAGALAEASVVFAVLPD